MNYYFITSLPTTPPFGEPPPVSLLDLYERACEESDFGPIVAAVMLEHDLLDRQSILSGESERPDQVVLSAEQVAGQAPLPEYLQAEQQPGKPVGDDATWEQYYRYVRDLGVRTGCGFLVDWAGFEVGLRNALVVARAKTLELNADEYLVAAEIGQEDGQIEGIVSRWSTAPNPLAAQRVLDEGRWDWLEGHGRYFSFEADEVAAYARAVVLLDRWEHVSRQAQERAQAQAEARAEGRTP